MMPDGVIFSIPAPGDPVDVPKKRGPNDDTDSDEEICFCYSTPLLNVWKAGRWLLTILM